MSDEVGRGGALGVCWSKERGMWRGGAEWRDLEVMPLEGGDCGSLPGLLTPPDGMDTTDAAHRGIGALRV